MTFFEILHTFTFYGVDVILLAALTAGATQLIKKLMLKKVKKLATFLPFILGIVFYAAYAAVYHAGFAYVAREYVSVLEHGISVGAAATLMYVLYEQFVRDKKNLSATEQVIATLISGYVPDGNIEAAAKAVAEAIQKDVTGGGALKAEEILKSFSDGELREGDIKLLSRLIIETLAHLNA